MECDYFEFDDSSEIRTVYEDVKIYLGENYEEISIPRPNVGHPADIIHDFQQVRNWAAYALIEMSKIEIKKSIENTF